MALKWQDITVEQYQQLHELWAEADSMEEADLLTQMVAVCFHFTATQIDSLPYEEFKLYCAQLDFLNVLPEWKPVNDITVDGRRYRFIYDIRQTRAARIIEAKHNSRDEFVAKLHTLAASMVMPRKRAWYGRWVDSEYDAARHEQYALDLRQAPISAIYGSALFFSAVWQKWMTGTADYLTQTIPKERREEAKQLLLNSCNILDGSITPVLLQSGSA